MAFILRCCSSLAIGLPGSAYALITGADSILPLPEVCLISFYHVEKRSPDDDGNDGICTGTLVAPNIVLTAGHCVYDLVGNTQNHAIVRCGYDGKAFRVSSKNQGVEISKIFLKNNRISKERNEASSDLNSLTTDFDVGKIVLSEPMPEIQSISVARKKITEQIAERIDDFECFASGAGNSQEAPNGGVPKFARIRFDGTLEKDFDDRGHFMGFHSKRSFVLSAKNLKEMSLVLTAHQHKMLEEYGLGILRIDENQFSTAAQWSAFSRLIANIDSQMPILASGDSGGGLYCKSKDANSELRLVGINSRIDMHIDYENRQNPVFELSETWAAPFAKTVAPK